MGPPPTPTPLPSPVSGAVPDEPVVAVPTGHLYERRLIEKHVAAQGNDPVTGARLTPADLLPVAASAAVKPRPSPATSVPGLLGLFHNEWDALMLETHTLRGALADARTELAHALYQHDAALRVIARLVRERDAARDAYEARGVAGGGGVEAPAGKRARAGDGAPAAAAAPPPPSGLPAAVTDAMTELSGTLSRGRKKREAPARCWPVDAVKSVALSSSHALHKTRTPGVLALAAAPGGLLASGGADGGVALWDAAAARVAATLAAHKGAVRGVAWVTPGALLASAGADGAARLWSAAAGGEWADAGSLTASDPANALAGIAIHPSAAFAVTAAASGGWTFFDVATRTALASVDDAPAGGYSSLAYHPDGVILGAGTQRGAVRVWESRTQKAVATFDGHGAAVSSLAFSENGYHAAAAAGDGGAKVWDLRKLKAVATFAGPAGGGAAAVAFDPAGALLAVAGPGGVEIRGAKQAFEPLAAHADGRKGALSVAWAPEGDALWAGGGDHNVRLYKGAAE